MNYKWLIGFLFLATICVTAQDKKRIQDDVENQWDQARVNSESVFLNFLDAYDLIGEQQLFSEHESIILENLKNLKLGSADHVIEGISFKDDGTIIIQAEKYPQFRDVKCEFEMMVADFENADLRNNFIRKLYHKGFNPADQISLDSIWKDEQNNLLADLNQEISSIFMASNSKNLNYLNSTDISKMTDQEYQEHYNSLTLATSVARQRISTKFFLGLTHASQRALLSALFEQVSGTFIYRPPINLEKARRLKEDHIIALKSLKGVEK